MNLARRIAFFALLLGTFAGQYLVASVVVSPSTAQVNPGKSFQFSATGSASGVYIWNLSGSGCVGISCGSITHDGYYTAPNVAPQPATVTVTATSLSDLSQFDTATVTVGNQPVVAVSVAPSDVTLAPSGSQLFTATVSGSANQSVFWSVSGLSCSGSDCGTVSSSGMYAAPAAIPASMTVYVKATSSADSSKSAQGAVHLVAPIVVTVSPGTAQLYPGATRQFTAQVTGTALTTVKWSLSGAGCSGFACGTISSAGLYTAPAAVPNPAGVVVTATSTADSQISGTANVTILVPIGVTISPSSAVIDAGGKVQFHATVVGNANTAVTWSVSGASCSGSACGTVSSAGLYSAPATLTAELDVKVKATSNADSNITASAPVTVLVSDNGKLSGHYAFLFRGYDKNGVYQVAGSIEADGKGKILSGKEDANTVGFASTDLSITGSYGITSDNRGVITINGPLPAQTFRVALNASGKSGRLISFDQTGIRGSGVLYLQDPAAFDPSLFWDGFVVSLYGSTKSGARIQALSLIFPDGAGFVSGSSLDVNEAGVVPPTFGPFSGAYDIDPNGRGTMTLSVPGFDGGLFHFAMYVVSQKQLLLISTDPLTWSNPIFSGPAVSQQGGPFSSSMFIGSSVFYLTGRNTGANKGDVIVGRVQFKSGNALQLNYDRNSAGTVTLGGAMTGSYDMQINGRSLWSLSSGHHWLYYATAPDAGFLMEVSGAPVEAGEITPQVPIPFNNAALAGTYAIGSSDQTVRTSSLLAGDFAFSGGTSQGGNGLVSGTADISTASTLSPDKSVAGTYAISLVSKNGRGSMTLTSPSNMSFVLWDASPSTALGLQVDANATDPTVFHIEQ